MSDEQRRWHDRHAAVWHYLVRGNATLVVAHNSSVHWTSRVAEHAEQQRSHQQWPRLASSGYGSCAQRNLGHTPKIVATCMSSGYWRYVIERYCSETGRWRSPTGEWRHVNLHHIGLGNDTTAWFLGRPTVICWARSTSNSPSVFDTELWITYLRLIDDLWSRRPLTRPQWTSGVDQTESPDCRAALTK